MTPPDPTHLAHEPREPDHRPAATTRALALLALFFCCVGCLLLMRFVFVPPKPEPRIQVNVPAWTAPEGPVCAAAARVRDIKPTAPSAWCELPMTTEPDARLVSMLTRAIVHEAGLASAADADGIVLVILDRARQMNITPLEALRAYSPSVFASRRRDSSGWKVRVRSAVPEHMPDGWRSRARWDELGAPGVRMLDERVRGLLSGRVVPVCSPHHWGAQSLRREHSGWSEVSCVVDGRAALNAYWTVPRGRRASR